MRRLRCRRILPGVGSLCLSIFTLALTVLPALARGAEPDAGDIDSPGQIWIHEKASLRGSPQSYASLLDAFLELGRKADEEFVFDRVVAVDFAAWDAGSPRLINGLKCWYLFLAPDGDLAADAIPLITAFESQVEAERWQERQGGELGNLEQTWFAIHDWLKDQRAKRDSAARRQSRGKDAQDRHQPAPTRRPDSVPYRDCST